MADLTYPQNTSDGSVVPDRLVNLGDSSYAPATWNKNVPTSIMDGRKAVTTAGTAVQLSSTSVPVYGVLLVAETANTGTVVAGSTTVVASSSTRQGVPLNKGDGIYLHVNNLNKVWLDSTVSGEGVTYVADRYE